MAPLMRLFQPPESTGLTGWRSGKARVIRRSAGCVKTWCELCAITLLSISSITFPVHPFTLDRAQAWLPPPLTMYSMSWPGTGSSALILIVLSQRTRRRCRSGSPRCRGSGNQPSGIHRP